MKEVPLSGIALSCLMFCQGGESPTMVVLMRLDMKRAGRAPFCESRDGCEEREDLETAKETTMRFSQNRINLSSLVHEI